MLNKKNKDDNFIIVLNLILIISSTLILQLLFLQDTVPMWLNYKKSVHSHQLSDNWHFHFLLQYSKYLTDYKDTRSSKYSDALSSQYRQNTTDQTATLR